MWFTYDASISLVNSEHVMCQKVTSLPLTRHPLPNQLELMLFPKMAELISDIQ